MTNARPPHDDGERRFRWQVPVAAGSLNGDRLDARQAWLASFWALVLRRFRDYAHEASDEENG
jgi:hypothetical protein